MHVHVGALSLYVGCRLGSPGVAGRVAGDLSVCSFTLREAHLSHVRGTSEERESQT